MNINIKILFIFLFSISLSQNYDPMTGKIIKSDSSKAVIFDPMTGKAIKTTILESDNNSKVDIKLNFQQLKNIAHLHARNDADANISYYLISTSVVGVGSMFASFVVEQPLFMITPVMPLIALSDKGKYELPDFRKVEYESKYDKTNYDTYKTLYEEKRGQIQSTRHFFSSLLGPPVTFLGSIFIISMIFS